MSCSKVIKYYAKSAVARRTIDSPASFRSRTRQIERGRSNLRIVAKARQPVHARFSSKPCDLALREIARGLLNPGDRLVERKFAPKVLPQIGVPDELKRFGIRRNPQRNQVLDLAEPASRQHRPHARLDSRVEVRP